MQAWPELSAERRDAAIKVIGAATRALEEQMRSLLFRIQDARAVLDGSSPLLARSVHTHKLRLRAEARRHLPIYEAKYDILAERQRDVAALIIYAERKAQEECPRTQSPKHDAAPQHVAPTQEDPTPHAPPEAAP